MLTDSAIADHLVVDDRDLEHVAFLSGSIRSVILLLCELVPDVSNPWLEDEEPKSKSFLLEVRLESWCLKSFVTG